MFYFLRSNACLAASIAVWLTCNLSAARAGDLFRREPTASHRSCKRCRYTRESKHGLIRYPCAAYWASGDAVDHWGTTATPSYSSHDITPSPWAYRTIAPYAHQYRSFDGTGHCVSAGHDGRN